MFVQVGHVKTGHSVVISLEISDVNVYLGMLADCVIGILMNAYQVLVLMEVNVMIWLMVTVAFVQLVLLGPDVWRMLMNVSQHLATTGVCAKIYLMLLNVFV